MKIGDKLRILRGNMTQAELAQRSKVDEAIISKMESGKMSGTVACHKKLAEVFGFKLSEFYAFVESSKPESVELHSGSLKTDTYENFLEILTTRPMAKKMLPTFLTLHPKDEKFLEASLKKVERFIVLLKGELEVEVEGKVYSLKKELTAKKGDSLYSISAQRHRIKNTGHSVAQALCISTPPVL